MIQGYYLIHERCRISAENAAVEQLSSSGTVGSSMNTDVREKVFEVELDGHSATEGKSSTHAA